MSSTQQQQDSSLKKLMSAFETPETRQSIWQLCNTIVPFLALWFAAYASLSVSYWLSLAFAIPAAGFLIRIFIIFHDCCHQSFFRSRKANLIVGTITGIMTMCPYAQWRYSHSVHHATSSNLDRRGTGDIWTMTVNEYIAASPWLRLAYRIYRNPFVMFVLGPIFVFLIEYRFNRKNAGKKERWNTYITNAGIVGAAGIMCLAVGWQPFLMVQGTVFLLSGMVGIWLFYVQHQFEDTYFEREPEWDFVDAAMQGSSYYKLPKPLQWITGNIGFHHIHHLNPRVPNYYLEKVHESHPRFHRVPTIDIVSSLKALRFRLWDEETKSFVGFREIKAVMRRLNRA